MITKIEKLGVKDILKIKDTSFFDKSIELDGDFYLGTYYGNQKLLKIKERLMDNSDGSDWTYGGQTKTCLYYLDYCEDDNSHNWHCIGDIS